MKRVKKQLKSLLPKPLLKLVLPSYHLSRAVLANLIYFRPAKNMKVIAITGTNGKTTTATVLANMLKAAGYRVGVSTTAFFEIDGKRTDNDTNMTVTNPFRLQKTIAKMRRKRVKWLVLETTSIALHQKRIWGIPIYGALITNLTQDHLDYHGDMKHYAMAKARLLKMNPKVIVLNHDDKWFDFYNQFYADHHKLSFGANKQADVRISAGKLAANGTRFKLSIDKSTDLEVKSNLVGKFNVYNLAAAVAIAYGVGVPMPAISSGANQHTDVPGRLEPIDEGQPFSVLVDYAHTPDALKQVLEAVKAMTKSRVILVFGAAGDRDVDKRPAMGKIAGQLADRIILTDEEPYSEDPEKIRADILKGITKARAKGITKQIADRKEAIKHAISIGKPGDTVIIAGMGNQQYLTLSDKKIPWDEREIVKEALKKKYSK